MMLELLSTFDINLRTVEGN